MPKIHHPPPLAVDGFPYDALQADPGGMSVEVDGKYLHWDELRHRPSRPNITNEDWWQLIKVAREQISKDLPLTDSQGNAFTFAMPDIVQRFTHEVDRDASGRIAIPEDVTNPATRNSYIVSSLIEEAFRSSQLEGASTTRAVANEMIRTKRAPRTHSEQMILNNYQAMQWVRDHCNDPLTTDRLFELHAIVTRETLEVTDGAGRFRRPNDPQDDIRVIDPATGEVVHTPPPAAMLPSRTEQMCKFANSAGAESPFIHPVVRAILLHFWLAYDHPFVDGNGRTARALFYWSMLKQGYWLTEFISISRAIKKSQAQYDKAFLYTESDSNDTTYFVLNQLKVLRAAIDELFVYLKRKAQEVREVEGMIRGRDDLNSRQLALLSYLLRHPDARVTIDGHQTSHRVVYQTARTDLLGLVERGYLEQTKIGKRMFFVPVRDFSKKLRRTK